MGDATLAFVESKELEAISILEEIIQIEPGAMQAWTLLRNCFLELKQEYKAIQVGIIVALMSSRPNALWVELAQDSKSKNLFQQALFCFNEAIKSDKKDLESMWNRAEILEQLGQNKKAAEGFLNMWKAGNQFDPELRDKIIDNYMLAGEFHKVINLSMDCFQHAKKFFPRGDDAAVGGGNGDVMKSQLININAIRGELTLDQAKRLLSLGNTYSMNQIYTLSEAYNYIGSYSSCIQIIKQGQRWIQGRINETFWDDLNILDDDREFDDDREDPTGGRRQGTKGRAIDRAKVHYLDENLRLSLGRARLSSGEVEEGKVSIEAKHADRNFNICTLICHCVCAWVGMQS